VILLRAAAPEGTTQPVVGKGLVFALLKELVHLRDDDFQLPWVSFAPRSFLKQTPTFGFTGDIGEV